jgi:hypothetical protein
VLTDGGERFIDSVVPGIPIVTATRKQVLAWLDRPATMRFANTVLERVVERIAQAR